MTTSPMDATSAAPSAWVLRRSDPGGDDIMPGADATAGASTFGFGDLLDVINPLQQLPIVGTIYRALTGDTISEAARMAGGALYGGPFGLVGALANVLVEAETGQDIGNTAVAWLTDDGAGTAGGGAPDTTTGTALAAAPAQSGSTATPVSIAAAYAAAVQAANTTPAAAGSPEAQVAAALPAAAAPGPVALDGRAGDRLDAFIRQASAVRRSTPGGTGAGAAIPGVTLPGAIDPSRLQAAALKPPTVAGHDGIKTGRSADDGDSDLALAGGDAGSVNAWMLRALDKYEHMRKQETS